MTTRSGILNWSLLADRGAAYLAGTSRSVRRGCERSHLLPGLIYSHIPGDFLAIYLEPNARRMLIHTSLISTLAAL